MRDFRIPALYTWNLFCSRMFCAVGWQFVAHQHRAALQEHRYDVYYLFFTSNALIDLNEIIQMKNYFSVLKSTSSAPVTGLSYRQ